MSNSSGDAMNDFPYFDRFFTSPDDVVALTTVSFGIHSMSLRALRMDSIAGDLPVPGCPTIMVYRLSGCKCVPIWKVASLVAKMYAVDVNSEGTT